MCGCTDSQSAKTQALRRVRRVWATGISSMPRALSVSKVDKRSSRLNTIRCCHPRPLGRGTCQEKAWNKRCKGLVWAHAIGQSIICLKFIYFFSMSTLSASTHISSEFFFLRRNGNVSFVATIFVQMSVVSLKYRLDTGTLQKTNRKEQFFFLHSSNTTNTKLHGCAEIPSHVGWQVTNVA